MFRHSMVQLIRLHSKKLDRPLRETVIRLYTPFRWTPCFLQSVFEGYVIRMKKVSVIIELEEGCYEEGCQIIENIFSKNRGCKIREHFSVVSCCSATITPLALEDILTECKQIKKVYYNLEVKALLDTAVPAANARNVIKRETELTGNGSTIAIIDTGIYPHMDLQGRITAFVDFINGRNEPYDDNGHGTHCAGSAVGSGAASDGLYQGPAPAASVIGVKVLNRVGTGTLESVMQGIQWCIEYNRTNPDNRINILNLSFGTEPQAYENEEEDPMVRIVNKAWEEGMVVCAAAGNVGPEQMTIASPGLSQRIITVGALDDRNTENRADDDVAIFSSRGPTIYGAVKPDILAPGVNIISLRVPNSYLDKVQKTNRVDSDYFSMSGTSMATPICAGIIALMLENEPNLSPERVKRRLMNRTDFWNDRDPTIYGAGYINADRAIRNK